MRFQWLFIFNFFLISTAYAQDKKLVLRDTTDGQMDLSDYIINLHGFVPFPILISEPALGNFGGALGLVFISPKKNVSKEEGFHFPDITAIGGLYTANNTWGLGVFRQGSFPKVGVRYQVIGLYADVNLNFYRDVPEVGEKEFLVNMVPAGFILDGSKNLFKNKIFVGTRYQFFNTNIGSGNGELPGLIFDSEDFDKNLATLGFYADWDTRNSIFTADRGLRFKASYHLSREALGSDFNTEKFESFATWFLQPTDRWVSGWRGEVQTVADGSPFYYYPFIFMRGIPAMRYQGQTTLLFETEQRFDLTNRWSVVGFAGSGKTYSNSEYLSDDQWHWAGGAGFRYLLARLFNLRVGLDIAAGPEQFSYYMVFGHVWNR